MSIVTDEKADQLGRIIQHFMNNGLENFARRIIKSYGYDPIEAVRKFSEIETAIHKGRKQDVEGILTYLENRQKNPNSW